jgi:ankyrin repeat domain-containing protein 17
LSVPPPPIFSSTAPGQAQKSQADAQQQTKFVFNVDNVNDKTSQSLQLLFQLPPDVAVERNQQPQINNNLKQQQQPQVLKNVNDAQQQQKLAELNAAQAQTQSGQVQPSVQIPYTMINQNHQQNFISFQQQPQLIQQHPQQPQKVPQVPKFLNKNLQQVQVATQTQIMGTQTPQPNEANQQQQHQMHSTTSSKLSNVSLAKKNGAEMRKKSRYTLRQQAAGQNQYQYDQQMQNYAIPGSTSTGTTTERSIEIDSETDSNHDTALTLACAGGHEELVELLLNRKANIEHRDKKGFTPLILAATAGHEKVVEILINAGADLEAQSERTKDTPLSLACSGGRYEVVELLLKYGANKEHRNVSDYTPLSLAASGGYVNIIKLLLTHGAEINSRTGSKLGISPLMLAAMNGHAGAVRLLLDMGSDINAQIETNRNTALTLACFQGRHEVVSLLLDRKANVEHRAKTGLTPLMEAASGGYIEVGRVLLDKGADVNAAPVPSSRDTALTIAADKGHLKFVELLLSRGAAVEVKNKKGNSPLWLAANGGHLNVVEALNNAKADIDSQDNRKVSCLMAAFRKGHVKVVRWMVNHVTQFPSDQEMTRFISVVDREIIDKCNECVRIIRAAKETQAAKANINASILLKELDMEKSREDARKAAAAKRREKKKKKKQEKREAHRKLTGDQDNQKNDKNQKGKGKGKKNEEPESEESEEEDSNEEEEEEDIEEIENPPAITLDKEEGDSGIDQSSCSSSDAKGATSAKTEADNIQNNKNAKNQKRKNLKQQQQQQATNNNAKSSTRSSTSPPPVPKESMKPTREDLKRIREQKNQRSADLTTKPKPLEKENVAPKETQITSTTSSNATTTTSNKKNFENQTKTNNAANNNPRKSTVFGNSRSSAQTMSDDYKIDYFELTTASSTSTTNSKPKTTTSPTKSTNHSVAEQQQPREEEWKAVGRKPTPSNVTAPQSTTSTTSSQPGPNEIGYKKIQVPSNAISRVIGRSGSNINAIRAATGAHIEVEKQSKQQGDRSITIKGVAEATKHAHNLISTLIKDPDADILSMLPRNNFQQPVKSSSSSSVTTTTTTAAINNGTSVWEKCLNTVPTFNNPIKPVPTVSKNAPTNAKPTTPTQQTVTKPAVSQSRSTVAKTLFTPSNNIVRPTPGKPQENMKKPIAANGQSTKPITSSSMNSSKILSNSSTTTTATSFAAKLSGSSEHPTPITTLTSITETTMSSVTPTTITRSITPIGPPTKNMNASSHSSHIVNTLDLSTPYNTNASNNDITSQIQSKLGELHVSAQLEYSLFDNYNINKWSNDKPISFNPLKSDTSYIPENESMSRVDASKAPGYRGASINSPVSSKTSSNSATPPSTILATQAPSSNQNQMPQSNSNYGNEYDVIKPGPIGQGPIQRPNSNVNNNMNYQRGFFEFSNHSHEYNSYVNPTMSRLNPKASSFSTNNQNQPKMNSNQYGQSFMSNNNNFMKSPGSSSGQQSQNYQRSPGSSSSGASRWCNEFGNYPGMEFTGSSPSMSPNNNSQTSMNGPNDDSRKAPAPIGNERSYGKNYYGNSGYSGYSMDMDSSLMNQGMRRNSWMDKQPNLWPPMQRDAPMNSRGPYDMPNDFSTMQDILQVILNLNF